MGYFPTFNDTLKYIVNEIRHIAKKLGPSPNIASKRGDYVHEEDKFSAKAAATKDPISYDNPVYEEKPTHTHYMPEPNPYEVMTEQIEQANIQHSNRMSFSPLDQQRIQREMEEADLQDTRDSLKDSAFFDPLLKDENAAKNEVYDPTAMFLNNPAPEPMMSELIEGSQQQDIRDIPASLLSENAINNEMSLEQIVNDSYQPQPNINDLPGSILPNNLINSVLGIEEEDEDDKPTMNPLHDSVFNPGGGPK